MIKKLLSRLVFLILLMIAVVVFGSSLRNEFVWDDEEQIVNNDLVHSVRNASAFFIGSTFNPGGSTQMGGLYYKPMMPLIFSLVISVFGLQAGRIRLFQILLHTANAWMLFCLLEEMLDQLTSTWGEKFHQARRSFLRACSLLLATVFLIHPLNVETAIYLSSMQDVLYMFFGLTASIVLLKTQPSWKTGLLVAGLLLLSLLSKETGAIFVVWLVLLAHLVKKSWKKAALTVFVWVVMAYSFLRFVVAGVGIRSHGLSPITKVDLVTRLRSIPKILGYYFSNLFWPNNLAISQHWVVTNLSFPSFWLPLLLFLVLLAGLLFWGRKLWVAEGGFSASVKWYWLILVLLLLSLGLHVQVIPLDMTVADRWFYLPLVSLSLLTIFFLSWLQLSKLHQQVIMLFLGVMILPLSYRSMQRVQDWRTSMSIYAADIQLNPDAFDLQNNMGVALFRGGEFDQARYHFEISTHLAPDWWTNWNNLAVVQEMAGDYEQAAANYLKAIEQGQYYLAYENYAKVLLKLERYEEAVEFCENSLRVLPYNLTLWQVLIVAQSESGESEAAQQNIERLRRLDPSLDFSFLLELSEQEVVIE